MRYGFSIDDGRMVLGSRKEIKSMIMGALLAAGFDRPHSVQEEADKVLRQADAPTKQVQQVALDGIGELQVWLDRGAEAKGRTYLVEVGKSAAFRTEDAITLVTFIAGLMVADGTSVEKSAALGENVAYALSEGGSYPGGVVTELRDQREVRAWFEDATAGGI